MYAWKHFKTITYHRWLVLKGCFRCGLYRQGLTHDLSKYAPVEFIVGARYYKGDMSPNNSERMAKGYSSAWLHHKGRNKHHIEYWVDYSMNKGEALAGMRMPDRYIVEMFVDRVSAAKVYQKDAYTDASALKYYERGREKTIIHPEVEEILVRLLQMLADEGEDAVYRYIRQDLLKKEHSGGR